MKIIIAKMGGYLEAVKSHSKDNVLVLPYGVDWSPITEADCALEALLSHPLKRLPSQPPG